jgi:CheY-like chemotaxis protein/HPt (histidine-containing phosphotransfer) domain-containing protein
MSRPLTLLIVEDTKTNQVLFSNMLKILGYPNAEIAPNGSIALEIAKKTFFDVILMDHLMPVMDGVEAAQKILEHYAKEPVKPYIIALTGNSAEEDKEAYLKAGMMDYLPKPLKKEALAQALERFQKGSVLSTPEEIPPPLRESQVLNLSYLDGNFAQAPQVLQRVFLTAEKELPTILDSLEKAIIQRSYEDLILYSHRLKGMASNLGGGKLAHLAGELENVAKNKAIDPGTFQDLEKILEASREFILALKEYIEKKG